MVVIVVTFVLYEKTFLVKLLALGLIMLFLYKALRRQKVVQCESQKMRTDKRKVASFCDTQCRATTSCRRKALYIEKKVWL